MKLDYFTLQNGLQVVVYPQPASKISIVNLLYQVGSSYEDKNRTGMAHLVEHLLFTGSKKYPNFDKELERVGGQNNAFTSSDFTNYHISLPSKYIEDAFRLESDRMSDLIFEEKGLEVQRSVVIEELKETTQGTPYGDIWGNLLGLSYQPSNPYSWPTIGKSIKQLESITLQEVREFKRNFYSPSNAVLVIGGGVELEKVRLLCDRWFSKIPKKSTLKLPINNFLNIKINDKHIVKKNIPFNLLLKAFHIPKRKDKDYFSILLLCELLGGGESSPLYKKLVEEEKLLSEISIQTTQMVNCGLFIIEASLTPKSTLEKAESRITEIIESTINSDISELMWERVKNQLESSYEFEQMKLLNVVENLAFSSALESPDFLERETKQGLKDISKEQIKNVANKFLKKNKSINLYYHQ